MLVHHFRRLHPVASASTAAAGNSGVPHSGRTTSSALTCICRSDIGVYRRGGGGGASSLHVLISIPRH